jgi:hypothetical protein
VASPLANGHIEAQRRLRVLAANGVSRIWQSLPGYDRQNIDEWLTRTLPLIAGAQRASVALTEAYLARELRRQPLGINPDDLIGAGVRNGTPPEVVYERPFVTVWTALQSGHAWADAVASGLARATSTAETDVQLAMRGTLREVGQLDDTIYGYERVPDGNACDLCLIASTQRYHVEDLMPIHNRCGCGVGVITDPEVGQIINRERYTDLKQRGAISKITDQRRRARAEDTATAAIAEHGELGPVLVDGAQHFTTAAEIPAL